MDIASSEIVALTDIVSAGKRLGLASSALVELRGFAKTYCDKLKRLHVAHCDGDLHTVEHLVREIPRRFPAKVCSVVRAVRLPLKVPGGAQKAWTWEELKAIANGLSLYEHIDEPVFLKLQPTFWSVARPTLSFGDKRRAAQQLCQDILRLLHPLQPFDFLCRGRGAEAAMLHLKHLIEKENAQYVVIVDIKNCFGSPITTNIGKLLGLPASVVNHSLLIGHAVNIVPQPMHGVDVPSTSIHEYVKPYGTARRGIPQGSSASQLIMSRAILGPTLGSLPFVGRLIQYGDDIAVPAKDSATAGAILEALQSALSTTPVGPFAIGRHKISTVNEGADFLSYRISRKPLYYGGGIHFRPSALSYLKVVEMARAHFLSMNEGEAGAERASKYVERWMASFRLWKRTQKSHDYLQSSIQSVGVPVVLPPVDNSQILSDAHF